MTDHWDDDFDFDAPQDLPEAPFEQPHLELPEAPADEHPGQDAAQDPGWDEPQPPEPDEPDEATGDETFPPVLDVGELPEPIDGFPWIDTATLGTAGPSGFTAPAEPVGAGELAAYAGVDLPAGADPWAVLAADEDPATSALARWWTPGEQ